MLTEVDSLKAIASKRFVYLRWFILFGAIITLGLLSYLDPETTPVSDFGPLIGLLSLAAIFNGLILYLINVGESRRSLFLLTSVNIVQILLDLLLVALVIVLLQTPVGFLPLLFLLPIFQSLILFDAATGLLVALLSGGYLVGVSYLKLKSIFLLSGLIEITPILNYDRNVLWVFALVFCIFVVVVSNFTDIVKERQLHGRLDKTTPTTRDTSGEARQVQWIRQYSKKLEENNRLLRAKEIELTLAKEQLEALENAKSEFISVTTHQLRTPLSAIKWTFNMMISEQLGAINAEQKEFLDKGYQSALRMISIVNNLVHIDHATAKPEDYNFVEVNIVELVENVMFEFSNQAESKNINLVFDKPSFLPPSVKIDEGKIRMMLENLIDNAIKYTPKQGKVSLNISDERLNSADPSVTLSVTDTGVGIPKAEQDKIFHKFFRASNARRAEPDGSGIGLYIARDIVDRHGGTLRFSSEEGKGTTFYITLPIHQKAVDAV